jgi:hypothetical protein
MSTNFAFLLDEPPLMSDRLFELVKLFIDKGLLALLLLMAGFLINKAIERHRAKHVYYQKLSETKMEAYREVSLALSQELLEVKKIIGMIEEYLKPTPDSKEDIWNEVLKLSLRYFELSDDHLVSITKNTYFFSPALTNLLTNNSKVLSEFAGLIRATKEGGSTWTRLKELGDSLLDNVSRIQYTMAEELWKDPFS